MYDCIIIGMGPAGMGAGIYAKRSGLKTLILDESAPGGLLNKISIVENYLGFKSLTGSELAYKMYEHVLNEDIEHKMEKVLKIEDHKDYKTVYTTKNQYKTKGIIIAIGRKLKRAGIPNEDKFMSKGISYCAICDAALYKNKDILVLGGGNSAFEESLYLSKFAKNITILVRNEISADDELTDAIKNTNIKVRTGVKVKEFNGTDHLEGVTLDSGEVIKCDGAFVYYGYTADASFVSNLNITDDHGYILVDRNMKTKVDYIYACGDIIKKDVYQIINAVAEGAVAATKLNDEIDKNNK